MSEQVLRKVADITSFTIFYRALESISTLPPDDDFRRAKFLHQSRGNRLASAQLLPGKFLWGSWRVHVYLKDATHSSGRQQKIDAVYM